MGLSLLLGSTSSLKLREINTAIQGVEDEKTHKMIIQPDPIALTGSPWVKIGELYVTTTMTGETTWRPLIKDILYKQGQTRFTLFSGRHGDVPNCIDKVTRATLTTPELKDEKKWETFYDESHYLQDCVNTDQLEEELKSVSIQVVNTNQRKAGVNEWLKKETRRYLEQGEAVLYGWCYSLCTFCETDTRDVATYQRECNEILEKTVCELVNQFFSWVPQIISGRSSP